MCAACHNMEYLAFRNLIGVTHTEEEAKALAEEVRETTVYIFTQLLMWTVGPERQAPR